MQPDGTRLRYAACRACGCRLLLIVE